MGQAGYQEQAAAVDSQLADDFSGVANDIVSQADQQAAAAKKKADDRKAFLARFNSDTERAITEYSNAEIDPARLWHGGNGKANAIGAAIGAFVSGIAGYLDPSKDYAGQYAAKIERAVQQDIELQKAQIAKKGAGIEARRGLYASYLQQFGQEDAAEAMAYEAYLRKAKAQVDAYAAKASSEKQKINAGALGAALENQIAAWGAKREAAGYSLYDAYKAEQAKQAAAAQAQALKPYKDEYDLNRKSIEARVGEVGGIARYLKPGTVLPNGLVVTNPYGMHVQMDANNNIIDYGNAVAKAKAEGGGNTVTTITGFNEKGEPIYGQGQSTVKDPKAFNEAQQAYASIKSDLALIKKLRKDHNGGQLWSGDDTTAAKQASARIQLALKSPAFFQLGVIAGPDRDYLLSQLPDDPLAVKAVGAVGGDPIGTQLAGLESYLDNKYANAEATYVKGGAQKNTGLPLTKPVPAGK